MFGLGQNIAILALTLGTMLSITVVLNRLWPCERRHKQTDLIGWQLSILGTAYSVILGFMLYTVWTSFVAADLNADLEASALRNVYRLAAGLPAAQRDQLQKEAQTYANVVIDRDWPAMARGQLPDASQGINESMWDTLMSVKSSNPSEDRAADHALSELSVLTIHRRTRFIQSASHLPVIFWGVLIVGGTLVLISVSIFGSANPRVHAFQVLSVTLLITLVMLAIADINRPYRGWAHVDNYGFIRARQTMH